MGAERGPEVRSTFTVLALVAQVHCVSLLGYLAIERIPDFLVFDNVARESSSVLRPVLVLRRSTSIRILTYNSYTICT